MAGNTKLVGFGPRKKGVPGVIHLSRWDGRTTVTVSEESLESLREACYKDLPQQPQQGKRDDLDDFRVQYDESVGRIHMDMVPMHAEALSLLLQDCLENDVPLNHEILGSWIHSLKDAIQAHEDYHNKNGEPGINEDPM